MSEVFDYKKQIRQIFKSPKTSALKSSDASQDLLKQNLEQMRLRNISKKKNKLSEEQ